MSGPWIETYTGKKFGLLDPQPESICVEDIAHALSNQCRYTGHTKRFYSVAEHSCYVCELSKDARSGLMHDASEAYLSDLSRPVKHLTPVGPPYLEIEDRIMRVIADKFKFRWPAPEDVKKADNVLLLLEKQHLMTGLSWSDDASSEEARKLALGKYNDVRIFGHPQIFGHSPVTAEKFFLGAFKIFFL